MPAARALRRTFGTARHPRFPLIRRSATAPLCGFGRTAPPPGGGQAQPGRTQTHVRADGGTGAGAGTGASTGMEAWQHHHGTQRRHRRRGARWAGCLDSSDARPSQASTLVLVRQWFSRPADGLVELNSGAFALSERDVGLKGPEAQPRALFAIERYMGLRIDRDLAIQGDKRVCGV